MRTTIFILLALSLVWSACLPVDQTNLNSVNDIALEQFNTSMDSDSLGYRDTVYIPIYSSIYSKTKDVQFNLTATLSIRNTSLYIPYNLLSMLSRKKILQGVQGLILS